MQFLNVSLRLKRISFVEMERARFTMLVVWLKPGLYEPQLPVERSVTLVTSIVVEQRC